MPWRAAVVVYRVTVMDQRDTTLAHMPDVDPLPHTWTALDGKAAAVTRARPITVVPTPLHRADPKYGVEFARQGAVLQTIGT